MRSSRHAIRHRRAAILGALCASLLPGLANAQQEAAGFAVERLLLAPPGSTWVVLNDLQVSGGPGGAASFTVGYARRPLVISSRDGAVRLPVVDEQAFMDVGLAVTWERLRVYARFSSPLRVGGQSGVVDGWRFTAPDVTLQLRPDSIQDVHVGFDARLFGRPDGPVRAGLDLQLIAPSGDRPDYLTDNTYRGVVRLVVAGDTGAFGWAGHVGVHLRPLDEPPSGSPKGSELLFGAGGAATLPLGAHALRFGAELHGGTALRDVFGGDTTAVEALVSAAFAASGAPAPFRVKLAGGAGLHAAFGAPDWRALLQFEAQGVAY